MGRAAASKHRANYGFFARPHHDSTTPTPAQHGGTAGVSPSLAVCWQQHGPLGLRWMTMSCWDISGTQRWTRAPPESFLSAPCVFFCQQDGC